MSITKYTDANIKKILKKDLISHILELYEFISISQQSIKEMNEQVANGNEGEALIDKMMKEVFGCDKWGGEILDKSVRGLNKENEELKKENEELKGQNVELQEDIDELRNENAHNEAHQEEQTEENDKLKKENEILKKEKEEIKKNRFNYNVFDTERNNMVILLQQQKEENEELEKRIESTISFIKLCDNNEAGYTNYETRNIASRLIDGNITEEED